MGWQVRFHFVEKLERYFGVLDPSTGWIGRDSGSVTSRGALPATLIGVLKIRGRRGSRINRGRQRVTEDPKGVPLTAIPIAFGVNALKSARLSR